MTSGQCIVVCLSKTAYNIKRTLKSASLVRYKAIVLTLKEIKIQVKLHRHKKTNENNRQKCLLYIPNKLD